MRQKWVTTPTKYHGISIHFTRSNSLQNTHASMYSSLEPTTVLTWYPARGILPIFWEPQPVRKIAMTRTTCTRHQQKYLGQDSLDRGNVIDENKIIRLPNIRASGEIQVEVCQHGSKFGTSVNLDPHYRSVRCQAWSAGSEGPTVSMPTSWIIRLYLYLQGQMPIQLGAE